MHDYRLVYSSFILPIYSRLEPFSGKCTLMGECKCALVFSLRLGDN